MVTIIHVEQIVTLIVMKMSQHYEGQANNINHLFLNDNKNFTLDYRSLF